MKKFTKMLCAVLCLLLCASLLFSVGTSLYSHNHDCIGEDCQLCRVISLQYELMRLVLLGCFSASFALVFVQLITNVNLYRYNKNKNINLVTNKIKLTA